VRVTTDVRPVRPVGDLLRDWRRRRGLSQLDLSVDVGVSTRHLSFVETGRSRPSPDLILRLSEHLEVPLIDRNAMLLAGGYAPAYPAHELSLSRVP
jgi:transcriptional regulator with XRE-family HTH domain